jgi:5-methylcytosine-specific restriction endonuclease McrA
VQLTFENAAIPTPYRDAEKFFHISDQWIKLRYKTLSTRGNQCECCGNTWSVGNPLQVDHIKPRSIYPHLALDENNLQVLCRECNLGKSNVDTTDWRKAA